MAKAVIICGATASGKTSLAVDVAEKLDSEIVSADSQLIYRGLNIGTAKPTPAETRGVKHHLIDVVSPKEKFSVSDYEQIALPIVKNLLNEGKTPVICGGTGFYINSLLFNLSYGNVASNEEVRQKYQNLLNEKGKEFLFSLLKEIDLETAAKLHCNDTKRVIRALEIYETSGVKKSEQHDQMVPRFEYLAFAVDYPRKELYECINCRVDVMFNSGLVDEVKGLLKDGINENCQCMQAIGYKEVLEGLKNGYNDSTMRDIVKQNTRRYAKRQITLFKKLPNLIWLNPGANNADKILEFLR